MNKKNEKMRNKKMGGRMNPNLSRKDKRKMEKLDKKKKNIERMENLKKRKRERETQSNTNKDNQMNKTKAKQNKPERNIERKKEKKMVANLNFGQTIKDKDELECERYAKKLKIKKGEMPQELMEDGFDCKKF